MSRYSAEEATCPYCGESFDAVLDFRTLMDNVVCPHCNAISLVDCDEYYDEENGDDSVYFYLTKN